MASPSTDAGRPSMGPKLPLQLGRVVLCKELGAGGMATVFLGRMILGSGLDRLVAVKTIHQHLAKESQFVDMFLDEAKIASQINHPNCCAVHDFGDVDGIYYMTMEYLVGEPLIDVINRIVKKRNDALFEALPFLAARILADACEGLHAAHTLKGPTGKPLYVVHRDVSPQNLFITYDGSVKVVDFGCAKALERVTQTNTGIMKGKVSYAAPEQLKAQDVDARADVFALGVCLWETLTLQQLFRRDTAINTAMAVLQDDIPRADDGRAWVPAQLADIAARALARDREYRYPSARDMGRDLRAFIAQSGSPFESAELAEWMQYLFSSRYKEHQHVVSEVEKLDLAKVAKVAPGGLPAATEQPPSEHDSIGDAPTRLSPAQSGRRALAVDKADSVPPPRKRSSGLIAMFVGFLLAGGALAFALTRGDSDRESRAAALTPVPLTPIDPPRMAPEPIQAPEPAAPPELVPAPASEVAEPATPELEPALPPVVEAPVGRLPRDTARSADEALQEDEIVAHDAVITEGTVSIRAQEGWATVMRGGESLGRTPLRIALPGGEHQLRVLPFGNEPGDQVLVRVHPGTHQTLTLHVAEETNRPPPPPGPAPEQGQAGTVDMWEVPF